MTETAKSIFENASRNQHDRNEARRIRIRVSEARDNPHPALMRWPFELLQNAIDAGPAQGRHAVSISLTYHGGKVIFEHDGAPFTSEDLAALLSGGSSKEFISSETTGRFGTGFLVTHVLAESALLSGILQLPTGDRERFELTLDRSGDEEQILSNIRSCNAAIAAAKPIDDTAPGPSARFEYSVVDLEALAPSIHSLRAALPYLYGTCSTLGNVKIQIENGLCETWTSQEEVESPTTLGVIRHRPIRVVENGSPRNLRLFRFLESPDSKVSALALVVDDVRGWQVLIPEQDLPRLHRKYPLRASAFVPTNFIIDGLFSPDQERNRPLMMDDDKNLLEAAFRCAEIGTCFAIEQGWLDAHRLAWTCKPAKGFDPTDAKELEWWVNALRKYAECLARRPIVNCGSERLPAIADSGTTADFVIPRLFIDPPHREVAVQRMWPLVKCGDGLQPPVKEIAEDWTDIAEGWRSLSVANLNLFTMKKLGEYVKKSATSVNQLRVKNDRMEWLAGYIDLVGECWKNRSGNESSVLTELIPNQRGELRSPNQLKKDTGIHDGLKTICEDVGLDVRSDLLHNEIETIGAAKRMTFIPFVLAAVCPTVVTEEEVTLKLLQRLDEALPDGKKCENDSRHVQRASIALLQHLESAGGKDSRAVAQRIPLIAADSYSVRWGSERLMMAPVDTWQESARPFLAAYPPRRILSEVYIRDEAGGTSNVIPFLVACGIAIPDPIHVEAPRELKNPKLGLLATSDCEGVVIEDQSFSQIALLPDVINRSREGIEEAKALLGLVLCHVAPRDPEWLQTRSVRGRKGRDLLDLPIYGALWLADLKNRSWVPIPGENDSIQQLPASRATLEHLLNPEWLASNPFGVKLLSDWFGFDMLDLCTLGIAPDDAERKRLRERLARLAELTGSDPSFYDELLNAAERKRRQQADLDRCSQMGRAVQEAIKIAMERLGLKLTLVDCGFDYEVCANEANLEDLSIRLSVESYLLEIKASTTGTARLTSKQAKAASQEPARFVLCFVDLRGFGPEELSGDWTAEKVSPHAKIIPGIGLQVRVTHELVQSASLEDVPIRNQNALRYEVSPESHSRKYSIDEWVKVTFGS